MENVDAPGFKPSKARWAGSLIVTAITTGLTWAIWYYLVYPAFPVHYSELMHVLNAYHWNIALAIWNPLAWVYFIATAFDVLITLVILYGTYWVLGHIAAFYRFSGLWAYLNKIKAPKVERWNPWQRAQHILMVVTFIICAYTGFIAMLDKNPYWRSIYINGLVSFNGSPPFYLWPAISSPYPVIIFIHIISGIIMGFLVLVHFGYYGTRVIIDKIRGYNVMEKWPMLRIYTWGFFKFMWHYSLWLANPNHKFPPWNHKYAPEELFEYWGVYWGIAVLGIPGIIMVIWGPSVGAGLAFTFHTAEAVLAVSFLLLVHIPYAHFNPLLFPFREVFYSGKIPAEIIKMGHPKWYEELKREGKI